MKVLIADDEDSIRELLSGFLKHIGGFNILSAANGSEALQLVERHSPELVFLDINMPEKNGFDVMDEIKNKPDSPYVIIMSGDHYQDICEAEKRIRSKQLGSIDFLPKPFNFQQLSERIRLLKKRLDLTELPSTTTLDLSNVPAGDSFICHSEAAQRLMHKIGAASKMPQATSILLLGETGSGKEYFANMIHNFSALKTEPFICVNLAASPDTLIESELFGYERGAFTGAYGSKNGKFEEAGCGSILLDEIGDISPSMQAKLLRAIDSREYYPVGSNKLRKIRARIMMATHRNLTELTKNGQFRADLYYRVFSYVIKIPPLRVRTQDIGSLIDYFAVQFGKLHGLSAVKIPMETYRSAENYSWEGNIRELKNWIEREIIDNPDGLILFKPMSGFAKDGLDSENHNKPELSDIADLKKAKDAFARKHVESYLSRNNGDMDLTADQLNVSKRTLYRILEIRNNF